MEHLVSTDRFVVTPDTSGLRGAIRVLPIKTLWLIMHGTLGIAGVVLYPSLDALLVFLVLTAITICAGHSVGMHRLLIHRSFQTPRWLEYLLVWLGTLVGMAGPIGMVRTHDLRDWHQRQTECPPHPSHEASFFKDAYWQLCCEFRLTAPPRFAPEPRLALDPAYKWMERTWMLQQLPLALVLFAFGGWAWVLWGVSLRVAVSLIGHWMVGHFAHRRGHQGWHIEGLPVQGYNLRGLSWITFGENWHGNHHAFPHSARLGVEPGQADPGYWFIRGLMRAGLAWGVKTPGSEVPRRGLMRV
jgi:fatty-acid desaturase